MNRKRILRWVAAVCLLVLAVCTGVSYFVYDALLPRIEVYNFIARDSPNPNDYEIEWWVPESCIQSRDEHDQVTIYRVLSRVASSASKILSKPLMARFYDREKAR